MRRFCTISIFLCVSIFADAQDARLRAALLEREAFRSEEPAEAGRLLLDKAALLLDAGQAQAAGEALSRVRTWLLDETEQQTYRRLREEAFFRAGAYDAADSFREPAGGDARLDALVAAGIRRYEESRTLAAQHLQAVLPEAELPQALHALDALYANAPRLKKEKTATALAFLPPLGHWYTGHYGEGLFSMLGNAAAAGLIVWQVLDGSYITGLLGGGMLLERTFMSNVENSAAHARAYNEAAQEDFLRRLDALLPQPVSPGRSEVRP